MYRLNWEQICFSSTIPSDSQYVEIGSWDLITVTSCTVETTLGIMLVLTLPIHPQVVSITAKKDISAIYSANILSNIHIAVVR